MLTNALAVAVLAIFVAGLNRVCRRPALIHGLWLVVLLKLVTPPFVPVSVPHFRDALPASVFAFESFLDCATELDSPDQPCVDPEPGTTEDAALLDTDLPAESAALAEPLAGISQDSGAAMPSKVIAPLAGTLLSLIVNWKWEYPVLFVILAGAIVWWALAARRIISFQELLRDLRPVPTDWQSRVDELAERLRLKNSPTFCLVPGRVPPMLWAVGGRPLLLVPSALWSTMGGDERTSLLLHELAHLKRRDHWVRWFEFVIGGLYWWHPAVWWIRRSLREAEEQCCDAWVVWAMPKGAKTYAGALLTALEFVSGARNAPAAASATSGNGHVSSLKRRMQMILRARPPKGLSWAGCCGVLVAAALVLPLAPSWAQKSEPDQPPIGAVVSDVVDYSEFALAQQDRAQPNTDVNREDTAPESEQPGQPDDRLKNRVLDEFQKDPEVIALRKEITKMRNERDQARNSGRQSNDPSLRATTRVLANLEGAYENLLKEKYDTIRQRLQDDGKGNAEKEDPKDVQGRTGPERLEQRLKDLIDVIRRELGPSFDEIQKALEKAVDDLHQALKKEDVSAEDLRKSLEKSYEDIRQALSKSGPVDKELRQAWERSRGELRQRWAQSREEMRKEMREQVEAARQRQQDSARRLRESRDAGRRLPEAGDAAKSQDRSAQDELTNAQREVRELQQQLNRATRRLVELQRRQAQRSAAARRSGEPSANRTPDRDPNATSSRGDSDAGSARSPSGTRVPATPRQATPPSDRTPSPPRGELPPDARVRNRNLEYDRRFRELDNKLDRLLKELEKLRDRTSPKDSKAPNPRTGRVLQPGATAA
jgi:beta-lactamase regulating signal transducer with metallopeptidase domain